MKHTDGPWEVVYMGDKPFIKLPNGVVFSVNPAMIPRDYDEANARLIAAAPEMVAALEAAADAFRFIAGQNTPWEPHPALLQIEAVLAKAKGE